MLLCISVLYILLYLATSSPAFPSTAGSLLRKQNLRSSSNVTEQDRFWMRHALQLALQARGRTRPNPCVGCVIVDADNKIVGEGFHERAGGPHAEVHALRQAGDRAVNGTAYVTLEPCNHYGRTPPCTLALLKAGIRRVVAGLVDPDPRVSGKGLEFLRSKQIEICLMDDMEANACLAANLPFIHRVLHQTPFCTLLLDPSSSLLKCKDCNNLADAVGSMDTFITSISYLRGLTPNSDSCADIGRRLVDLLPDYLTIYIVYEAADAQEKLLSQEVVEILISCGRAAHHISVSMEEVIVALAENGTCNGVVVCSNEMATATKQGFQRLLEVSGQNASVIVTNCWNPTV